MKETIATDSIEYRGYTIKIYVEIDDDPLGPGASAPYRWVAGRILDNGVLKECIRRHVTLVESPLWGFWKRLVFGSILRKDVPMDAPMSMREQVKLRVEELVEKIDTFEALKEDSLESASPAVSVSTDHGELVVDIAECD